MTKDSLLLLDIYKRYLEITSDLIEILERNYEKSENGGSEELKSKLKEFREHGRKLIIEHHNTLHTLLKIDQELKEIEDKEQNEPKKIDNNR